MSLLTEKRSLRPVMLCALITFTLVMASGVRSFAQRSYFYFGWDVNQPLSNTSWIDETSTRGAKLGFRKFIGEERRISVGLDLNWNYLETYKPTETFYTDNGAVTTDYFNNIFQMAGAVTGQYYFPIGDKQVFYPYVGLGLGANRNQYTVSYNIYQDEDVGFGFLARPEVGILVRIGERRRFGLTAAVHYDYSTNSSSDYGYNNFMTAGFQIGVVSLQW
ncbi:MAG TPA: hypothetical protein VK658_09500 [Chryseolinea sp.]|nr:hypothetical protein [Chryseolinea sp.]